MAWGGRRPPESYQSFPDRINSAASLLEAEEALREVWSGPLRCKRGLFSTFVYTHDPRMANARPQRKILHYDYSAVCSWGGLAGSLTRAGVFRITRSLSLCLCGTTALAVATAVVASWVNEEEQMDMDAMDTMQQRTNIMVTFILGFFVQLNLSRWWNHREYLRTLHGALADVLIFVASSGNVTQEHVMKVARLGMLSQALLFEEVRGAFRGEAEPVESGAAGLTESPYSGLIKLGLLHPEEVAELVGKEQKAQFVWVWIARLVQRLLEGDPRRILKIQSRCCSGRGAISCIKTQLDTQLPFTYVQLIAMLVQCSHLVMAVGCGYTAAAAWGSQPRRYALMVAQVVQTVLVPLTFQSLLDVCAYVNDPYGSDVLDFSFLHHHLALAGLCESLVAPPSRGPREAGPAVAAAPGSSTANLGDGKQPLAS
mmetsp:Transcript_171152/g.416136  ORF Transcript_171152/g.416136 Transcript_171152/m.416136 type:complete len:427 (+) Transcript_171152:41-1321(+)